MDIDALAEQMRVIFKAESLAGLDLIDAELAKLKQRENLDSIEVIFRTLHTVRGSASMAGLVDLSAFAFPFEAVYDQIRLGKQGLNESLISLTSQLAQLLRDVISTPSMALDVFAPEADRLTAAVLLCAPPSTYDSHTEEASVRLAFVPQKSLFSIHFKPGEHLIRRGVDVLALLDELAGLGCLVTAADLGTLPRLDNMTPDSAVIAWRMLLLTDASAEDVNDVFLFVVADSQLTVACLATVPENESMPAHARAVLQSQPSWAPAALLAALNRGFSVADPDAEFQTDLAHAPLLPATGVIAVPVARLNLQIDLVGELMIAQSTLMQVSALLKDERLTSVVEHVIRLTTDMRDNAMSLLMVPIGDSFDDFAAKVATVSGPLDTPLNFVASGAETELDQAVASALKPALLQLLQDCAEHCVARVQAQKLMGQTVSGTVQVTVEQSGAEVLFCVSDDSQCLSCSGHVTVQQSVEALHGSFLRDCVPNVGARYTIRLPISQGIISGLLVAVANNNFVLPLAMVEEVVDLKTARDLYDSERDIFNLRGKLIPFVRLGVLFDLTDSNMRESTGHAIIVNAAGRSVGILVDRVVGQHQTVVKKLSSLCQDNILLAGATILGDGTVAFILDVVELISQAEIDEVRHVYGA